MKRCLLGCLHLLQHQVRYCNPYTSVKCLPLQSVISHIHHQGSEARTYKNRPEQMFEIMYKYAQKTVKLVRIYNINYQVTSKYRSSLCLDMQHSPDPFLLCIYFTWGEMAAFTGTLSHDRANVFLFCLTEEGFQVRLFPIKNIDTDTP